MTDLRRFIQCHSTSFLYGAIVLGILLIIVGALLPAYFGWFRPVGAFGGSLSGTCALYLWRRKQKRAESA